ncbi:phosphate ABC transporter substrate-binding protein, PhoT family [Desulfatibacillum alkenivorans DSM 16219]|jgi:phosphate transport system substrate-binding protein|uniref:Phosphate ABC transporter substrate-binding protein, PhoT family n=1 Tax=Desulfatibacillum alkenivorans DSM 16219 TaxID=1121393 RepID=A0A1M6GPV5_9BACT|nr:substrate-binding domain-containing protein [Desulfatibacillum alkenivorans]SHJ11983.1 phosphate ABC transporter substrate-binding protein, PhoT family [Desulfatibacillum alkenivorans DSM 16219]
MRNFSKKSRMTIVVILTFICTAGFLAGVCFGEDVKGGLGLNADVAAGGTGSALGAVHLLAKAYMAEHPGVSVKVLPSLGSGGGINALVKKRIDVSLSVRPLKDKEKAQGLWQRVYARAPFVFATTAVSSSENMTYHQLEGIYSGRIQSWPDGSPIHLIVRPAQESDTLFIKSMTPELDKAVDKALARRGMMFAVTDQDTADLLESNKGALASLSLGQIMAEKRAVKVLSLEGAPPLIDGKVNPEYPYFKTYYMIFRPGMSPAAQQFADFVFSERGIKILEDTGHLRP